MLSAEDTTAANVAIEVCNRPEIKKEILCTLGSEYDKNKGIFQYENKRQWSKIVEKKATVILEKLGIAEQLQEIVIGIVLLAGIRMLTWAEYHESTLGISREYSFKFLNRSLFTKQGIIDNKKAAEELIKDETLIAKQKYKLACLYCFTDCIPVSYKQMTKEDKKEFYDAKSTERIKQPGLVKFWSYYLMSEIDKLKGEKTLDQYRLEKAVENGSKSAVQYCLEKTKLSKNKYALVEAAVEVVKCIDNVGPHAEKDWVMFENQGYKDSREKSWVPSDYYVDILSFLLSKMGEDQLIEFLKMDVIGAKYKKVPFRDQKRSRVLEYLLDWPYQDYFMKTVGLMWEFLPEKDYAVLLLRICDKIKPGKEGSLNYGEERSYDYKELLREFWHQSPERLKRYVFSNPEVDFVIERVITRTRACVGLVMELLTLKNYTCKDRKNVELILASATEQDKEILISSEEWRKLCMVQMMHEKWEMLDRLVLNSSLHEGDKYKKEFCFTKEAKRICICFIKHSTWNAVETFIKWSSLSEEEVNKLKKEILFSEDGRNACVDLITKHNKLEPVDQFIRWCISSEEEVRAFRKELAFSNEGTGICAYLVEEDLLELASEFIDVCLSSESEITELKKMVAYKYAGPICEDLISDSKVEGIYDKDGYAIGSRIIFNGGKWEGVEEFLTWCFSSEQEMRDFKKNVLLKESGKEIHFNLIKSSRWHEAETFFAWLGLSTEEIKELKKDTLFNYAAAREMFFEMLYGEELILDYGSREEAIELLLRWFLSDKETVLEFKDEFKRIYKEENAKEDMDEKDEVVLEDFDSMIEQRLRDLDEEQLGVKRKSETFNPSKRHCNLNCENTETEYGK